jgi:hypothetical protein
MTMFSEMPETPPANDPEDTQSMLLQALGDIVDLQKRVADLEARMPAPVTRKRKGISREVIDVLQDGQYWSAFGVFVQLRDGGSTLTEKQVSQALCNLADEGRVERPRHSTYRITDKGRAWLAGNA